MKYFKPEELYNYDYKDITARQESDRKWQEARNSYFKYFDTIKYKFSKEFLSLYYKNDGFHDSLITNINIDNLGGDKCNIRIVLKISQKLYALNYKAVSAYNFCVPQANDCFFGTMCWMYSEFELLEDGQLNHKVLCDADCEFEITCKKIYMKKVAKIK